MPDVEPPAIALPAPDIRHPSPQDRICGRILDRIGAHDDHQVAVSPHELLPKLAEDVADDAAAEELEKLPLIVDAVDGRVDQEFVGEQLVEPPDVAVDEGPVRFVFQSCDLALPVRA